MPEYFNPVKVIKTNDWLFQLNKKLSELNVTSPIIVTSAGNKARLNLANHFMNDSIFSDIENNPTFSTCNKAIKFCSRKKFNGVVAIGGGSVMDAAKVINAHLSLNIQNILELINNKEIFPQSIPSFFIPTTHGSGSEVTMWGTVWDIHNKKKYSISNKSLYPNYAILDAKLTLSLPLDISITTCLDALSHSLEAIWNKNANEISTDLAIEAISSIIEFAPMLKINPSDLTIRKKLLHAANTAGLAFSNTKTAAAHSLSYSLTLHHDIPHGIASSLSLIPLLDKNKKMIETSLQKICNKLAMTYEDLKKCIKKIPNGVIPFSLSSWNIPVHKLSVFTEESFKSNRMENNIIDLSKEDVLSILKKIY